MDRKEKYETTRHQINFRLTHEEFEKVSAMAGLAEVKISSFCRDAVLKRKVKPALLGKKETAELLAQIGRIGGNINQVAKRLNQGGSAEGDLQQIRTQLAGILKVVMGNVTPRKAPQASKGVEPIPEVVSGVEKPVQEPAEGFCPRCNQPMKAITTKKGKDLWRCEACQQWFDR